ncbi:MAG: beta-L-arabinofuranosidase domain-containing protein, partial [Chloroflexota bacterium]
MSIAMLRPDIIHCPEPGAVHLKGLIGQRFQASLQNRLRHQEEEHLLWPFREHCPVGMNVPGRPHPEIRGDWQGEFMGTWLDAAILSAWNTGDVRLRQKIDALVEDWLATQQKDGYLGTYDEKDRWKSWDIWVQAHDLIGLLSHYWYTRDSKSLNAAIRVADRVLLDFGPGKRSVYPTGLHGGMASSAILEPLIWLYRETGDQRYLDWGRWLVDIDWEQPDGPRIVSSLLAGRGVANTANAKGIEMLICFAGMVELYRATGDEKYLQPVLLAWDDIVEHHLFITGSASTGEYFMKDYLLRNDGVYMIGETCVSMGWLYLNLQLGKLLGEARFFDMAEQTLYNHLLSAQSPDGRGWQYYTGLRDHKRYRWHTDPECCP